ncbi:MAG TPA: serine/threonine-protein kinase [Trueperaceae bacterium]|nr:serine/threonine-protein kinase [Trueperaceae bacterium]
MSSDQAGPAFVPPGYAIVNKLGSGQTAHVYLAKHPVFGDVALKLPRVEVNDRPVLKRMFENEVSITVKLASPNIVAAFDGYPAGDGAFLALEYCAGGTLDQLLLEQGRLPLERTFRLVQGVALGLAHTHERKVLHRDVKPANVFLTSDGTAKLGDFGTGVFQADEGEDRVGTAFYMGPEVFEGNSAGARSDVYSLGVLAYEVIAGVRPFVADSYEALMVAHHTAIPKDLMTYRHDLDPRVKRVVAKAMTRDPEQRFENARAFAAAFAAVTAGDDVAAHVGAERPTTGRASRAPATRQEHEPASGKESAKESAKGRGVLGWLRRNRD